MAAGGAAAAAAMQAIKAMGVLVRIEPDEFDRLVHRQKDALVVYATGGLFTPNYQYLMSYKGLTFFTKSHEPLCLPHSCEIVHARSIAIPG